MQTQIKICGITSNTIINLCEKLKVHYLGFVFYPKSPRNLSINQAKKLTSGVSTKIKKVAVVVNPNNEFLDKIKVFFDYFQLHGSEDNNRIKEIKKKFKKKIIKAIKIKDQNDFQKISLYKDADEILLDSPAMEKSEIFNFNLLNNIDISPYFLAGGINISNVDRALKYTSKIDISSGVEISPGIKDEKKIIDFINKIESYAKA